ncbi:MAG: hypothetical protein KDB03_21435 [Planctomycetales bacterium]|nr:hypothetical protein [Planctomycetales bacterium]
MSDTLDSPAISPRIQRWTMLISLVVAVACTAQFVVHYWNISRSSPPLAASSTPQTIKEPVPNIRDSDENYLAKMQALDSRQITARMREIEPERSSTPTTPSMSRRERYVRYLEESLRTIGADQPYLAAPLTERLDQTKQELSGK